MRGRSPSLTRRTRRTLAVSVAAALSSPVHLERLGAGHVIDGSVVSTTRTVVVQLDWRSGVSPIVRAAADHRVAAKANPEPDAGVQPSPKLTPRLSEMLGAAR